MVRRLVAAGVGLLVIIVLVLGIKGCLNSRQEQALKDYNRDVASLVQESNANTDDFYTALTTGGTSSTDVAGADQPAAPAREGPDEPGREAQRPRRHEARRTATSC